MKDLAPTPRAERPALPAFDAVPRKLRHDGWTPERQRAFVEALADTGSVQTACRMVNMSTEGAYHLRRQPGAEGFRRAWAAALDMGVERIRDEAWERAINGQLVPVFSGGKLMGYRRQKNDRLLMFILRHHRRDREGRRVTVNLFSATASATAGPSPERGRGPAKLVEGASARAIHAGPDSTLPDTPAPDAPAPDAAQTDAAETVAAFDGVELDAEAQAGIAAILASCAARRRALAPEDDPEVAFVHAEEVPAYLGEMETGIERDAAERFDPAEPSWELLDQPDQLDAIAEAVAAVKAARTRGEWDDLGAPPPAPRSASRDDHDLLDPPDLDWRKWKE